VIEGVILEDSRMWVEVGGEVDREKVEGLLIEVVAG